MTTGAVVGLVAVTPASGYAGPMGALVLGIIASVICYIFCSAIKNASATTMRWTSSAYTASAESPARS